MTIDQAYNFCLEIVNKEQRGSFPPAKFNLLAPICQLETISNLLGNEEKLNERGIPKYGFKFNRKIDTLLRPLVTGPVLVTPTEYTITNITKANPGVVTFSSIGSLVNGSQIMITSVVGMMQVNGNTYVLKNISGTTAELWTTDNEKVNTSSYTTYSSAGTAYDGGWAYPSDYIWPDAVHKLNYSPATLMDSDQYTTIKNSVIHPPSDRYPVVVFRDVRGFVDPLNTVFRLSYVKKPTDPVWNFTVINDEPVYNPTGSVDFALDAIAHQRICLKILQAVGINLDAVQVAQFAKMKESEGT